MSRLRLLTDERGAVMLIAVFFAVFAVAMLYLAIGAGESVLHREHLQDAADSAALSGAITHARTMNVLVLINMVMVTLLAILVTLKLIEGVAIVGMAIAAGLAWCTAGGSLAAIPPLKSLRSTVSNIYEEVKPTVFMALETLHDVGDQIAESAPSIANDMAQANLYAREDHIVEVGIATTTVERLPIEDDSFEGLCGRAGKLAWKIAEFPLSPIPGWDAISGALDSPIQSLTSSLSQWFCGDGENSLPDLSQVVPTGYPKTDKAAQCEASEPAKVAEGAEKDATTTECDAANAERIAGTPDASGSCTEQCEPGGPFDLAVTRAREQCDPSLSPAPKRYRYQVQEGSVEYKWNGAAWVRGEPELQTIFSNARDSKAGKDESSDRLPCQVAVDRRAGSIFDVDGNECGRITTDGFLPGYNRAVHPVADLTRVLPACTSECAPRNPPPKDEVEPTRKVHFRQVTHVFSCVREQRLPVDVHLEKESPKSQAKKGGNDKSPKTIAKNISLGDEPFQVRAVAIGSKSQRESARLVRLGLWGKPDPSNPLERLRELGGFAFAQAEYYYEGSEGRDAWMWNMNWRGRLKRFDIPANDEAYRVLHDACNDADRSGKECSRVLDLLEDWQELLVH